jgi:hypothetical protein
MPTRVGLCGGNASLPTGTAAFRQLRKKRSAPAELSDNLLVCRSHRRLMREIPMGGKCRALSSRRVRRRDHIRRRGGGQCAGRDKKPIGQCLSRRSERRLAHPCRRQRVQRSQLPALEHHRRPATRNAAFPGKCLNFPQDIEALRLVSCWDSRHWSLQPDGHITAAFGGCLTVLGGPDPGTAVGSRTCGGGPEQGWDSIA